MQCKGIDIALPHTWSLAGVLVATYSCRVPDCCPNKWQVFLHGRCSIFKTGILVAKTVATGRGGGLVYSPAPHRGAQESRGVRLLPLHSAGGVTLPPPSRVSSAKAAAPPPSDGCSAQAHIPKSATTISHSWDAAIVKDALLLAFFH